METIQTMLGPTPSDYADPIVEVPERFLLLKNRAQRFPICALLRYRQGGNSEWNETTTVNISRTGVLLRNPKGLKVAAVVEMQILLPSALTGEDPVTVCCYGPVTRVGPIHAAARISDYRFQRGTVTTVPI